MKVSLRPFEMGIPEYDRHRMFNRFSKWLPALVTGLIIGFAVVIFSHRH